MDVSDSAGGGVTKSKLKRELGSGGRRGLEVLPDAFHIRFMDTLEEYGGIL